MSHWPCSVTGCDHGALLSRPGTCKHCIQHFCFDHIDNVDKHPCKSKDPKVKELQLDIGDRAWQDRQKALLAKIDVPSLIHEAQRLRPGHTCSGPTQVVKGAEGLIVHGGNIHIILTFEDGVKWLARIKQALDTSPPLHVQRIDKLSEAATYRVLHDAGILVPQSWTPISGNGSELNYFFIEFVDGKPHDGFHGFQPITRSPTDRELIIIESYAKFMLSLEKLTFPTVGSPTFDADDKVVIGPVLRDIAPLADPPFYLGPFERPKDYYIAYFDTVLAAVLENRWCGPDRSLLTYGAMLEAKRLVEGCQELSRECGPYYIKHGEAKCDHFLLDEDLKVTAMLDWEWACTTSKASAYAAPLGFEPVEIFFGNNDLSLLETALAAAYRRLGRDDLAGFVENGKKYQRLDNLLHGDFPSWGTIKALRSCLGDPSQEEWPSTFGRWELYLMERYKDDAGLAELSAAKQRRKAQAKGDAAAEA